MAANISVRHLSHVVLIQPELIHHSAAYTALPLTLYTLDVHLTGKYHEKTSDNSDYLATQGDVLIEAMKILYRQYDGVEWVVSRVRDVVNFIRPAVKSTGNWVELLTVQPRNYARIALAVDLTISNGKMPNNDEITVLVNSFMRTGITIPAILTNKFGNGNHSAMPGQRSAPYPGDIIRPTSCESEDFSDGSESPSTQDTHSMPATQGQISSGPLLAMHHDHRDCNYQCQSGIIEPRPIYSSANCITSDTAGTVHEQDTPVGEAEAQGSFGDAHTLCGTSVYDAVMVTEQPSVACYYENQFEGYRFFDMAWDASMWTDGLMRDSI